MNLGTKQFILCLTVGIIEALSLQEKVRHRNDQTQSMLHNAQNNMNRKLEDEFSGEPEWTQLGDCMYGNLNGIELGHSVSLSYDGTVLVTGSYNTVQVHEYDPLTKNWILRYEFKDELIEKDMEFYRAVISDDESRIIISEPSFSDAGLFRGAAQVFEKGAGEDLTTWTQLGDTFYGREEFDLYGYDVDISATGSRIIIGAYEGNYIEVYDYNENLKRWTLKNYMSGSVGDGYGFAVALSGSGERAIVGAPAKNQNRGKAHIIALDDLHFIEVINGSNVGGKLGSAVDFSADGTHVIIGEPGSSNTYVYHHDSDQNEWSEKGMRISKDDEYLGTSVAISEDGSSVAVGAPLENFFGPLAGSGYSYSFNTVSWDEVESDFSGNTSFDECGTAIKISSNKAAIAVGCPGMDNEGFNNGKVCVYSIFIDTAFPTASLTTTPSAVPTVLPTENPTEVSTKTPTMTPTEVPTKIPTVTPTEVPTVTSTMIPTVTPTISPTSLPTKFPTVTPSLSPTVLPTMSPTVLPTMSPTVMPTMSPMIMSSISPTVMTTISPTAKTTISPTELGPVAGAEVRLPFTTIISQIVRSAIRGVIRTIFLGSIFL